MTKVKGTVITILIVAAVGAVLTLAVPKPSNWQFDSWAFYWPLLSSVVMATLHTGAAVLFLSGLNIYKADLKRAYRMFVGAILLTAIGTIQLPIIDTFDLNNSFWVTGGVIIIPFLLSGMLNYFGARSLARLVGVKSLLTKATIIVPLALVASFLSSFLPHSSSQIAEIQLDASVAFVVWTLALDIPAAVLAWRVKTHIGAHYVPAMTWLSLSLIAASTVLVLALGHYLVAGGSNHDTGNDIVDLTSAIVGLVWLRASYEFVKTRDY